MITNIQAAKELLAHYKSLTLAQLEHEWSRFEEDIERIEWGDPSDIVGGDVLHDITGFGTSGSCTLCNACNTQCDNCVYKTLNDYPEDSFYCLDDTYTAVEESINPDELYTNLQFRIERLEKAIKYAELGICEETS